MVAKKSKEKKKKELEEFKKYFNSSNVIIADAFGLSSSDLKKIRKIIKESGSVAKVIKKSLVRVALDKEKFKLFERAVIPFVIFTQKSPFEISKILVKNKFEVYPKKGEVAKDDIVVKAGVTDMLPNEIDIFKELGIKTKIHQGKIKIEEDTVLVKKGEKVSNKIIDFLKKINYKPIKRTLIFYYFIENGKVYEGVEVDVDKVRNEIAIAISEGRNLALNLGIVTAETLPILLVKAVNEAKALALNLGIISKDTIGYLLSKAHSQASLLQEKLNLKNENASS